MGTLFEQMTLPSSATTKNSSVINAIKPRLDGTVQKVGFAFNASAVSGTNLDIDLMGSMSADGSDAFLLKDAIVADITATGKVVGYVDVNLVPAPFYLIRVTTDADESANTLDIEILGQLGGSQS